MKQSLQKRLNDTATACMALLGDSHSINVLLETGNTAQKNLARKAKVMTGNLKNTRTDSAGNRLPFMKLEGMFYEILNQEALGIIEGKIGGKQYRFDFEKDECALYENISHLLISNGASATSHPGITSEFIQQLENASMAITWSAHASIACMRNWNPTKKPPSERAILTSLSAIPRNTPWRWQRNSIS